jgi:hypothetical protein
MHHPLSRRLQGGQHQEAEQEDDVVDADPNTFNGLLSARLIWASGLSGLSKALVWSSPKSTLSKPRCKLSCAKIKSYRSARRASAASAAEDTPGQLTTHWALR